VKIFELATNEPLFPVETETFGLSCKQIDDQHEKLLHQIDNDNHFTAYLSDRLPSDFDDEGTRLFASFLLSMLRRLPQKRKATTDLLSHSFLRAEVLEDKQVQAKGHQYLYIILFVLVMSLVSWTLLAAEII
jgi:serine/threonine protein kinase